MHCKNNILFVIKNVYLNNLINERKFALFVSKILQCTMSGYFIKLSD